MWQVLHQVSGAVKHAEVMILVPNVSLVEIPFSNLVKLNLLVVRG